MPHISPHLFVYKFPITAISSITARVTGLCCSAAYLGTGFVGLGGCERQVLAAYRERPAWQKGGAQWVMLFATSYHTLAGLRHLVWDANPGLLTTKQVARSSRVLFASAIGTATLMQCALWR